MTEPSYDRAALLDDLPRLSPREQVARLKHLGEPEAVLLSLGEAAEQLAVTDVGRALVATECLVSLADVLPSPLGRARVRRARAHALCNAGRLEEGWLVCNEAARLADGANDPVEAGRARLRSMQALGELGRFDESIAAGEAALDAFLGAGQDQLVARAEVNLGIVYQRRDQPGRAVEYFDHARPLIGDEPFALGTVDNNRGEALLALNDFEGAEAAFQSALEHYERAGASVVAGVAQGNLADLAARQGLLHRSVYHFERARRRFEATQSAGHLARLLTEQAEALGVLGLPDEALRQYEMAIPQLDRAGLALEAARARAGLGTTLMQRRRLADAETALAAAARAFDQLGHRTAGARVDLFRAELSAANGLAAEARSLIHSALAVLHDRPIEAATARRLLARLALEAGDLDSAEADLAAALGIARRLNLAPLLADILHTRGHLRRRQGDMAGAVEDLRAATAQVERVRGTLQAERFRGAFLSERVAVYEDLLSAILDEGAPDAVEQAFTVAEQAKSRLLLELARGDLDLVVAADTSGELDPDERGLLEELGHVRTTLNGLYSRLADEHRTPETDGGWRASVVDYERRLEVLEDRLSTTRGVAGLYAQPADLEAVASALPASTTLIEYVFAAGEVLAFVIGGGKLVVVRGLAATEEIDEWVARLQFQINRALRPGADQGWLAERLLADVRADLRALDGMLLEPLRRFIPPGDRLLIVPHGALHLVPFHALWDGSRHLIERHEVHYAPSASLYLHLCERRTPSRAAGRPLVVGVADERAPQIAAEVERVAARLGAEAADVLVGEDATAERFQAAAAGTGLVHLACHARYAAQTPLGSGVKLADRWLTVRDIYALRLEADLVTLSGCETGRSFVRAGDELVGLLRGFFAAGVASLLVSFWRVDDECASELMTSFYDQWHAKPAASGSKAAALRAAQIELLARRPHPAFWAPFRLVGRS
ncbi:MAG: CHAT domain-containing protein [Planctomycetota bacterium]|jgi:CHAT domain-containing protein/tetratricopeptide (TPR) repeat protein